jgi:hypothetical protein
MHGELPDAENTIGGIWHAEFSIVEIYQSALNAN